MCDYNVSDYNLAIEMIRVKLILSQNCVIFSPSGYVIYYVVYYIEQNRYTFFRMVCMVWIIIIRYYNYIKM